MRYWFDTEFIEDGKTIELISIGIVSSDDRTLYLESNEFNPSRACPWVQKNVLPHLSGNGVSRKEIAEQVLQFVGRDNPEFWGYFAAYDWVVLCQLYGRMIDLPQGWPMFCRDLMQLGVNQSSFPKHTGTLHNALDDAWWTREAWEHVMRLKGSK
ncbi:MAG: 3'-5' exoribonuclease domain-containing protein [Betaproteobacteria bacterium]